MANERDALEILTNLLYLIEKQADHPDKVLLFVHQASLPMQLLSDYFSEVVEEQSRIKAA